MENRCSAKPSRFSRDCAAIAEIALSIMSEIVMLRRGGDGEKMSK
jgi:hypothetical protein